MGVELVLQDIGAVNLTTVNSENPLPVAVITQAQAPYWIALDFEALAVSSSVVALTPAKYSKATRAVMIVESNAMRYRYDLGAPAVSTSVGMNLNANDNLVIEGLLNLERFRIIRQSADGTLNVTYERRSDESV